MKRGPWDRPSFPRAARPRRGGSFIRFPRPTRPRLLAVAPLAFIVGFLGVWRTYEHIRAPDAPASIKIGKGDLVGRATVVDGDTIRLAGESVRFNGIDAPESRQTCTDERGAAWRCGADAANRLDAYLAVARPTRCIPLSRDQYGRVVADCFRADGANVASWLVRNGLALDWPRFSNGRYATEQNSARNSRAGLWRGAFQPPWEWRSTSGRR